MSQDPNTSGSFPHAPAAPTLVGQVLDGRYRLIKLIGEGGMGEVYAAEHLHIEKRFAIKLLKQEIISNPEAVIRFRQEARSASSIGHRNIIAIEDFGQLPDGRIYMCMELLNGAPLNEMIKEPMMPDRLLNILIQTGHGLAAAHAKGITHRDMKPENIFVTIGPGGEDVPKLLDFGIAKVAAGEGQNHLTRTGTIFGTPYYMAPEQALGSPVDARTDVYAMGVILYECFAGSVPFQGAAFMAILTQHITSEAEPVAERAAKAGRQLPPGVAEIIGYCMAKEPANRYQTMDDLVNALVTSYRNFAGAGMSTYLEAFPAAAGSSQPAIFPPNVGTTPTAGMPVASTRAPTGPALASTAGSQAVSYSDASASMVAPAKKSKLGLLVAMGVLLLSGGGGAAWYFLAGPGSKSSTVVADPANGSGSQAVPIASGSNTEVPVAVVFDAAPIKVAVTVDAAPAIVSKKVMITSNVVKFDIYDGAEKMAQGPDQIEIIGDTQRTLTLKAAGYEDLRVDVTATKDKWEFTLKRIKSVNTGNPVNTGTGQDPKPPPVGKSCANTVLRPGDPKCRKEYCKSHPEAQACILED
jgi:eukaryotic-like serine/threonine-protein kinase